MTTESELVRKLRNVLENSKKKLEEQNEILRALTASPFQLGVVVDFRNGPLSEDDSQKKLVRGDYFTVEDSESRFFGANVRVIDNLDSDGDVEVRANNGEEGYVHVYDHHNRVWIYKSAPPLPSSNIGFARVVVNGSVVDLMYPPNSSIDFGKFVRLSSQSGQIVGVIDDSLPGEIANFVRFIQEKIVEVTVRGERKAVFSGKYRSADLKEGDQVILDYSGVVVTNNIGQDEEIYSVETTTVGWNDIGGLSLPKQILKEAVEFPLEQKALFEFYGKKQMKGALLYGPAGCGKTMLGKAVATSINKAYGNSGPSPFMYIKGPELLNHFVGDTELSIRTIFARSRRYYQKHNLPMLIFFDEAEALFRRRGTGISTDIFDTIVPMMLSEMDGFEESKAFVMLATNRPELIDPAILRDERISRPIEIGRPRIDDAKEIFKIHLGNKPLNNGFSHSDLAELGANSLFAPENLLYKMVTKTGDEQNFTLANIVSGAMISGVIDRATSLAMHRDISQKGKSGLKKEDIVSAVGQVYAEQMRLDHTLDLQAEMKNNPEIVHVEKIH